MARASLETKVRAVNRANAYAMELYPKLIQAVKPFVGKKIVKESGDLFATVERATPPFPNGVETHVYRYSSDYALQWVVKTCECENGLAHYHGTTVYVGNLRDGVLVDLYPPPNLRTDYTAEEVEAARERYRQAKKAADEALSALYPFGE